MDNRYIFDVNNIPASVNRSTFVESFKHPFTMKAGQLIPHYCRLVIANSTIKIPQRFIVRSVTPISATMDVLYGEYWYFFVPLRLVWPHFKQFLGENDATAYTQKVEYDIPMAPWYKDVEDVNPDEPDFLTGSLGDYMLGLNPKEGNAIHTAVYVNQEITEDEALEAYGVSELPLRAYYLIVNEWVRNQNIEAPILVDYSRDDANDTISYSDPPFIINKLKDWAMTLLPEPQKGDPVELFGSGVPLTTGEAYTFESGENAIFKFASDGDQQLFGDAGVVKFRSTEGQNGVRGSNLYANISLDLAAIRTAAGIQQILERDNRGGTRYKETLFVHWGARLPDSRAMIPEYLGGKRFPLSMSMVPGTANSSVDGEEVSRLGQIGALSNSDSGMDVPVLFSTPEPGIVMGLFTVRAENTYSQGIDPMWQRKKRYDFFYSELEGVGDLPVKKKALKITGDPSVDNQTIGFQEAYFEDKIHRSFNSGFMNPSVNLSLDYLTYGQVFNNIALNPAFIKENSARVGRTLFNDEASEFQFLVDFYAREEYTAPMKLRSTPGKEII